jgi:hypothetical protein
MCVISENNPLGEGEVICKGRGARSTPRYTVPPLAGIISKGVIYNVGENR